MNDNAAASPRGPPVARAAENRHVLLLGATGLIGSAVAARLTDAGHGVVAVARGTGSAAKGVAAGRVIHLDMRHALTPEDWLGYLDGVDAVVNCAGVLQDSGRDSTAAVHFAAPAALYEACAKRGVRRVIHVSAMGADKGSLTRFSSTKYDLEALLKDSSLDWVILRPSVVVGRAAYGGSALFRGLAALPWVPRLAAAGCISVVQLDDLSETVLRLLRDGAPGRLSIELAGPQPLAPQDIVARYRAWLGWPPARIVTVPSVIMNVAYALGDLAGRLGWRSPIRSTARWEMARGTEGDPAEWMRLTGVVPSSLDAALRREPPSVQERWFARLFLLKPVSIVTFAAFWIMTGIVTLGPGYDIAMAMMLEGGTGPLRSPTVVAGALADLVIGFAILWRRAARPALVAALALTIVYMIAGTAILPGLWEEPLGPLMKMWPILILNLFLLAILDER